MKNYIEILKQFDKVIRVTGTSKTVKITGLKDNLEKIIEISYDFPKVAFEVRKRLRNFLDVKGSL